MVLIATVSLLPLAAGAGAQSDPQWIDVEGASGDTLRAAVFRPTGRGSFPLILVLHGANGLNQATLKWSRALARAGFITLAGCYVNGGLSLRADDDFIDPCPRARGIYQANLTGNASALIAAGRRLPGVRPERLGLVGHSLGGNLVLVLASSRTDVKAAVVFSANPTRPLQLPNRPSGSALPAPIWRVEHLAAPVRLFHGLADPAVRRQEVAEYVRQAKALRKNVEVRYYEGAGQGLWTSRYQPELVSQSVAFFRQRLGR